jgi:hypothetical protein
VPTRPLADEANRGPWFVHGPKKRGEVVENAVRRDLEAKGLRVFPWYAPAD